MTQTEAYSAAARGSKCWAEVVVDLDKSQHGIDYPKALAPYDFLIVLSQAAADEIKPWMLKTGTKTGYVIWDNKQIENFKVAEKVKALGTPFQQLAVEQFGNAIYSNAILFGAFAKMARIFSEEIGKDTLEQFVPIGILDKNLDAFALGITKAEEFLSNLPEGSE